MVARRQIPLLKIFGEFPTEIEEPLYSIIGLAISAFMAIGILGLIMLFTQLDAQREGQCGLRFTHP
jgi:hypothetical protein